MYPSLFTVPVISQKNAMELIRKANGDVELIVSQPVVDTQQVKQSPEHHSTLNTYNSNDSDYDIDDNSLVDESVIDRDERGRGYNSLPSQHTQHSQHRAKTPTTHLDDEQVRAAVCTNYHCSHILWCYIMHDVLSWYIA